MYVALRQERKAVVTEEYPDHETYRALYARYYNRGAADLLRLLEPLEGMSVMDLCGGDGCLTSKMLASGARSVFLVDKEPKMVPSALWRHKRIRVAIMEVQSALSDVIMRGELLDRIVCQQAVNYWLDENTARALSLALRPGGVFVFNTFNQRPPETPRVLQYELDGHAFVEISWLMEGDVHHLQVRDGMKPHHTSFRWISPERFRVLLDPCFNISEERKEKTSLYRCEKK